MNVRAQAAIVLHQLINHGHTLTSLLSDETVPPGDQKLLHELCYGTTRWYFQLDAIVQQLLEKPLPAKNHKIHCLLLLGLYQIIHMRIPNFAAVTETVEAAHKLKKPWAKKLVNGVLRQFIRNQATLLPQVNQLDAVKYAHPDWLIQQLKRDYPNEWETILKANNTKPTITLRINQQKTTRETFQKKLNDSGISSTACTWTEQGLLLEQLSDVTQLPGFSEGLFSVQDQAAQLAAPLLNCQPGMRVLDACAAPGGKTTHLLETENTIDLIAIDIQENRTQKIIENCRRLGLTANIKCADINVLDSWWDGKCFERILLDVPCSATGVIGRHPDIKLLRRENDIPQLAKQQLALLNTVWPCLKPGGLLLYVTCSLLQQENSEVISSFLQAHDDAKEEIIKANWGEPQSTGRQLLPCDTMDGFYYALLCKQSS